MGKQTFIDNQLKYWHERKDRITVPKKILSKLNKDPSSNIGQLPFITISREYGCGGFEIADRVKEIFNHDYNAEPTWAAYDKNILEKLVNDVGINLALAETMTDKAKRTLTDFLQTTFSDFPSQVMVHRKLAETIMLMAKNGHVVIVGRAGNVFTRKLAKGFHVRLVASMDWKINRISVITGESRVLAKKLIIKRSKERENYIKKYIKFDLTDPHNYNLCINNSDYSSEQVARLIIESMKIKGYI